MNLFLKNIVLGHKSCQTEDSQIAGRHLLQLLQLYAWVDLITNGHESHFGHTETGLYIWENISITSLYMSVYLHIFNRIAIAILIRHFLDHVLHMQHFDWFTHFFGSHANGTKTVHTNSSMCASF